MATENDRPETPPLFAVKGDASPEEVAALVAVLQGLAAAGAGAADRPPPSEWSSHHRKVRAPLAPGRGGWRSSGQPR
jgi:acyl-CoA carboxylase epsilon subunit